MVLVKKPSNGGTTQKRVRESSSSFKNNPDLKLAIKFNELFGNIRILAGEAAIITNDHIFDHKSDRFKNITMRFDKLDTQLTKLKSFRRDRLSDQAYQCGLQDLKMYGKNIDNLYFQIMNAVPPVFNMVSPSRSS